MSNLDVLLRDQPLGTYSRDETTHEFSYEFSVGLGDVPLSLSLPIHQTNHAGERVDRAMTNLLPDDDDRRRRLAEQAGLASGEADDLLRYYGRECTGALRFLPPGKHADINRNFTRLHDDQIAGILDSLESYPTGLFNDRPIKMSLAGTQEKIALAKNDPTGHWLFPSGEAPSTHIFKPPRDSQYEDSHLAEYVSMSLCDELGLWIPGVDLEVVDGRESFVIERFDRIRTDSGSIRRIHQEDFNRAMGRAPSGRYPNGALQSDVNPDDVEDGTALALELLDNYSTNARSDQASFVTAQFAQWLIGATDGHFKNYALYLEDNHGRRSVEMAPLYDITSAEPYSRANPAVDPSDLVYETNQGIEKPLDHPMRLALPIGPDNTFAIEDIDPAAFVTLADTPGCRLSEDDILDAMESVIDNVDTAVSAIQTDSALNPFGDERLRRIVDPIVTGTKQRAEQAREFLNEPDGSPDTDHDTTSLSR